MITAYLTMDDGPTKNTPALMDYLCEKNIVPVFFFEGQQIEKYPAEAREAIQRGAIACNHSYDHPDFDELSYEECIDQLKRTEKILDELYLTAGVVRKAKLFRFPFGTRGGNEEKEQLLQKYLKENRYQRLDDSHCRQKWYQENHFPQYVDVDATFSFDEWRMAQEPDCRLPELIEHIEEKEPTDFCPLFEEGSHHIICLHDHDFTNDILPEYYRILLDYVQKRGVTFVNPLIEK